MSILCNSLCILYSREGKDFFIIKKLGLKLSNCKARNFNLIQNALEETDKWTNNS